MTEKISGIYSITNKVNGKQYIGQSIDMRKRWRQHKLKWTRDNTHTPLYLAMNKYGIDKFHFELIQECEPKLLDEKEMWWINELQTCNGGGYNLTAGGQESGSGGYSTPKKIFEQELLDIYRLLKYSEIPQSKLAERFGVDQSMISLINTGDSWFNPTLDYPLRDSSYLTKINAKKYLCIECGEECDAKAKRCKSCYLKNMEEYRRLSRPTREELKNLIRKESFTVIGKMYNVSDSAIRKWCVRYELPKRKIDIRNYSDAEWNDI